MTHIELAIRGSAVFRTSGNGLVHMGYWKGGKFWDCMGVQLGGEVATEDVLCAVVKRFWGADSVSVKPFLG